MSLFLKLSRFHFRVSETVGREYKFRYVLNRRAFEELKKYAIHKGPSDGKNYLFGVEFRVDPSLKGLIMAEVLAE